MKRLLTALLLSAASLTAAAQIATPFTSTCNEGTWRNGRQKSYCETRDLILDAPKSGTFTVDGRRNGGITVKGYAGTNIRVRAKLQSWGTDEAAAKSRVEAIQLTSNNNTLRAEAAGEETSWSVSYELFVPEKMALALQAHNGGIALENLRGPVTFETQNGGVSIVGSGGDLKGRTQNGGLSIKLTGAKWDGKGLDVTTTNGGISWQVPAEYSAALVTSTQRGAVKTDFPTNVQGTIGREVAVNLGKGGAQVKAVTTNGGVSVSRGGQ